MTFIKNLYKLLFVVIFLIPSISFAGNISASSNMAWGDKLGWINFATDNGNVNVTNTAITGYAWSANHGWINLSPDNGGVFNDGEGNLSGFAWGDKTGWVNFTGVSIDPSTGIFSGQTTEVSTAGIINFSCDNCSVITSWRNTLPITSNISTGSNSKSSFGSIKRDTSDQPASIIDAIVFIPTYIYDNFIPDFIKPKSRAEDFPNIEEYIKSTSPLVFNGKWNIFPHKYSDIYVLAPLPKELKSLAVKFPALNKIFNDVGVNKITDLEKLRSTDIRIPNISEISKLPSEVVFAGNGLVNLSSTIQVSDKGEIDQRIQTIVNKTIKLSVKPISKVDSVTGYLAFITRRQGVSAQIPMDSSLASAIMSILPSVAGSRSLEGIEKKLIVSTFEYADTDKDGIYTVDILAPQTEGEYEVITLIKYSNPELGTKEMRLITIVDPEGYVFEKIGMMEARVPYVKISIFRINKGDSVSNAVLWNAKDYNQDNPQYTDKTGKYSFLVPEGEYYITAEATGYKVYRGDKFSVREGKGIHFNIELIRSSLWRSGFFDWKFIIIIILVFALLLNFWYERRMFKKIMQNNNIKN